jgi:hypothetical protein
MKYLIDLKIGDKVWEVYNDFVYEKKILRLSELEIKITNGTTFPMEPNISHIADRLIAKSGSTLCLTLEDACIVAKLNCFVEIKEHIKVIAERGKLIDQINNRIDELNNLQI